MKNLERISRNIDRMSSMGAIRDTEVSEMSGVAQKMSFRLLEARLSQKAASLVVQEDQIWGFFAAWEGKTWDGVVKYLDRFDITDENAELDKLLKGRASGIRSTSFAKAVDKQIASLLVVGEDLEAVQKEIDGAPVDGLSALTRPDADQ